MLTFADNEKNVADEIVSVLRNRKGFGYVELPAEKELFFQDLKIYPDRREVYHRGKEANLTFTQFEILYLLANNPGRLFSKDQIYDIVWKESYAGDNNIVMSHVRNIREKIEDNPSKPIYIQTVWGVGYRFNKNLSSGL